MVIHLLHQLIRLRFHQLGFTSTFIDSEFCGFHSFRKSSRKGTRNILFLHGLGTSSSTWIHILPAIREFGNITCLDLPGHGFSKITSGEPFFSMQRMENALEHFINITYRSPIVFIGHSLGGWLAARYAAKHPEMVRHLILINNAGVRYDGFEKQADAFTFHNVDDVRHLLQYMWFRYPWYFKPFTSSIYRTLQKKQVSRYIHSIEEEDLLNQSFSSLTMPLDVVWGAEDRLISHASVDIMKKHAPQLKEHVISCCGHVPQLEQPRELASILNFILASP